MNRMTRAERRRIRKQAVAVLNACKGAKEKDRRMNRRAGETYWEYDRRKRMCAEKNRYKTKEEAMLKAGRMRSGDALRWYECPYCGGWHLTHNPELEEAYA